MRNLLKRFCRRCSVASHTGSPNKGLQRLTYTLFHNSFFNLSLSCILSLGLGAYAQAPGSSSSHGDDAALHSSSKRARKYDVDRIGERGTGRGINIYSISRERALGQELANSIDHSSKFVEDHDVKEYVNDLGQRIVRNSDAQIPFTVKVLDSSDVGVFGLPGGFLYVDRGLITALDGEAELASMMAHEIAHVAARHTTRGLTRRRILSMASTAAMFAGPVGVVVEDVSSIGGSLSRKKFDRDAEYEADLLGMEYAYAAGYDPDAFLSALEKVHARQINMQDIYKKIPGYKFATKLPLHKQIVNAFSDYPPIEDRIRHLQKEIALFLPNRDRYIVDSSDFEEVKARLLASDAPVLLRTRAGADAGKGPVLRRKQD
jgi:Zn-dependent protease with chaperone function